MKKDETRSEEYVLQVRENTQKYIGALIEENERLRSLVNDLEEQRKQTDRRLGIAESELGRIESERQKLAENRKRLEKLVAESNELEQKRIKQLARVYAAMRPREAALILETLEDALLIRILRAINDDRQKGKIVASLSREKAARISRKMGTPGRGL